MDQVQARISQEDCNLGDWRYASASLGSELS
jgi:hypothetical protein